MCYLPAKANFLFVSDALQLLILDPEHTQAQITGQSLLYDTDLLFIFVCGRYCYWRSWNIYKTKNGGHIDIPGCRGRGTCSDVKFFSPFHSILSEGLQDELNHSDAEYQLHSLNELQITDIFYNSSNNCNMQISQHQRLPESICFIFTFHRVSLFFSFFFKCSETKLCNTFSAL